MSNIVASMKLSLLSSYLIEENYNKLKNQINNVQIKIKQRDIGDFTNLQDTYDYIVLSNIFEYQNKEEFKNIIEKYKTHLNEGGQIIVGYAYHDIDLTSFSEYNCRAIPSRYTLLGTKDAPDDHIITVGKK